MTELAIPEASFALRTMPYWRTQLGRAAVAAWAVALVWFCFAKGFPFDRANQSAWILTGLGAAAIARPWRRMVRIVVDWVPFILLLYLYDYSRGAADLLGTPIHVGGPIAADRALFFGVDPTVWLQQHFFDPQAVHWWDVVGALIYCSHFLAVWVIAAVLYQRNRDHWYRWVRALVVLSFAGVATFAILPSAPPWYAARLGFLPPIERISTRGLSAIGLHAAQGMFEEGRAVANYVAAIPSLHTAFAVLICAWFVPRIAGRHRWWAVPLLVAYPIAMLAMLVYSGEHYVFDGLIGAVYVAAVLYGLALWDRWRTARRDRADPPDPPAIAVEPTPLVLKGSARA